jgi:hypothetical protein
VTGDRGRKAALRDRDSGAPTGREQRPAQVGRVSDADPLGNAPAAASLRPRNVRACTSGGAELTVTLPVERTIVLIEEARTVCFITKASIVTIDGGLPVRQDGHANKLRWIARTSHGWVVS